MRGEVNAFQQSFLDYAVNSGVAALMLLAAVTLYVLLTPWKEFALVRDNNTSAGIALSGAVVGLSIPIAAALATSMSLYDVLIWGVVALLLQLIVYRVVDLLLGDIPKRIQDDEIGAAVLLVGAKLATAFILAAGLWDPSLHKFVG
jgi:putative membrane protein